MLSECHSRLQRWHFNWCPHPTHTVNNMHSSVPFYSIFFILLSYNTHGSLSGPNITTMLSDSITFATHAQQRLCGTNNLKTCSGSNPAQYRVHFDTSSMLTTGAAPCQCNSGTQLSTTQLLRNDCLWHCLTSPQTHPSWKKGKLLHGPHDNQGDLNIKLPTP